ncbi:gamma-glutamyltransferase family protein [Cytobacillus purgationiresistens]|uniref:Gamma-glutamyltranspeptidase/glutathione hydrolase n=1 Tax=Cytobacillus purgationiresistens TaxID=863449 RepID=A0ABU0AD23_9BACI|nr:gamma-glutamyltransferase [Cytobacillus purgationiresistens]MDQ0269139.1 gamma-glutamyltranspeptidase/glutathione hydrolase [Cytobacillus purgationiresistens]
MKKKNQFIIFVSLVVIFIAVCVNWALKEERNSNLDIRLQNKVSEEDREYAVSASHPLAVEVGLKVLDEGGNAVDAAVAVSYALAVVEPYASGLGGGGEMLVYKEGETPFLQQYREIAPLSSKKLKTESGIPGFVKGMEEIHQAEGDLPFESIMNHIIPLAEEGIEVDSELEYRLKTALKSRIDKSEATPFFIDGRPIEEGDKLVQKELAETLRIIRDEGVEAFYHGALTDSFADQHVEFERSDFGKYTSQRMEAIKGEFMGYDVWSAAPPFSGLSVIQTLQMTEEVLEDRKLDNEVDFIQAVGEMSKIAYEERLYNIGDLDYTDIDMDELTSKEYSRQLLKEHELKDIFSSSQVNDTEAEMKDYAHTTHFVIMDKDGMTVSATNSLGNFFGTGEYMKEGFFLNNALTNYSKNKKSPNSFEPGKRPRSFISPTILMNEDEIIGIGSPGGRRIPAVITQTLLYHLLWGDSLQEAVERPRFYMENKEIQMESKFEKDTYSGLQEEGYNVILNHSASYFGSVQALSLNKHDFSIDGAADPRRIGLWESKSKK